jgi:hypothetical protein
MPESAADRPPPLTRVEHVSVRMAARSLVVMAGVVALAFFGGGLGAWWVTTGDPGSGRSSSGPAWPTAFPATPVWSPWEMTTTALYQTEIAIMAPTPTGTAGAPPPPTGTTGAGNDCDVRSTKAGVVCRVPYPPPPTATAFPDCAEIARLEPGDWCRWPSEGTPVPPTPGGPR